jgi:hypothetical protein
MCSNPLDPYFYYLCNARIFSLHVHFLYFQVAEHLVSNVRDQCTIQELPHADRKQMEIETEKLNAKLEHVKIQNSLLEMNANEMKTHCER